MPLKEAIRDHANGKHVVSLPPPVPAKAEPTAEERCQALQEFRFSSAKPVEKPESVISIGDHILATRGNIMTVAGQAKAGKSGLLSAILAGVLALPGDTVDLLGLTVKRNEGGRAIIHIDGEQSRYDHHRGMSRILGRVSRSTEPEWFHSYNFRQLDITDRTSSLRNLCTVLAQEHQGVHLIVLDGGADFVFDTNDLKESNEAVKFFESLAIEFECPVVVVLHFNPGSEKGRGHFGSQLERKSETVISVSKDKASEISTVEGKFLRNSGNIPNLQFIYDKEKGHHVFYGMKLKGGKDEAKQTMLKELAEAIFEEGQKLFTRTELGEKIMNATGLKLRQAQTYIKDMVTTELIKHSEGDNKFMLIGGINAPPF